jgi:hypothetical protein
MSVTHEIEHDRKLDAAQTMRGRTFESRLLFSIDRDDSGTSAARARDEPGPAVVIDPVSRLVLLADEPGRMLVRFIKLSLLVLYGRSTKRPKIPTYFSIYTKKPSNSIRRFQ